MITSALKNGTYLIISLICIVFGPIWLKVITIIVFIFYVAPYFKD